MSLTADIDLKDLIRTIPDYPKPGIMFRDITTLLGHANGFRACVEQLARPFTNRRVQAVAGIEARGFILGGAVAHQVSAGFVPIRKRGKLPYRTEVAKYTLEYGEAEMEMHIDGIKAAERVVLLDDLLATGGTSAAAAVLIRKSGGELLEAQFLIELQFLDGRKQLEPTTVTSFLKY